jgi:hypothetical protein
MTGIVYTVHTQWGQLCPRKGTVMIDDLNDGRRSGCENMKT